MIENWRDIEGYEGYYQVSNYGRVKSLDRDLMCKKDRKCHRKGQIIKQQKNKHGYAVVTLRKPGEKKTFFVHRLVALAFIPNPEKHTEINHKDENKTNNFVTNLEWCDRVYNILYGTSRKRSVANTDYSAIWDKRRKKFGPSGGNI